MSKWCQKETANSTRPVPSQSGLALEITRPTLPTNRHTDRDEWNNVLDSVPVTVTISDPVVHCAHGIVLLSLHRLAPISKKACFYDDERNSRPLAAYKLKRDTEQQHEIGFAFVEKRPSMEMTRRIHPRQNVEPRKPNTPHTHSEKLHTRLLRICIFISGWPLASGLASAGRAKRKQFGPSNWRLGLKSRFVGAETLTFCPNKTH